MIRACPVASKYTDKKLYDLIADRPSDTYTQRKKIRDLGGIWDGSKCTIGLDGARELGAAIMCLVIIDDYCHETQKRIFVSEADVARGFTKTSCGLCDSRDILAKIIKVVE